MGKILSQADKLNEKTESIVLFNALLRNDEVKEELNKILEERMQGTLQKEKQEIQEMIEQSRDYIPKASAVKELVLMTSEYIDDYIINVIKEEDYDGKIFKELLAKLPYKMKQYVLEHYEKDRYCNRRYHYVKK